MDRRRRVEWQGGVAQVVGQLCGAVRSAAVNVSRARLLGAGEVDGRTEPSPGRRSSLIDPARLEAAAGGRTASDEARAAAAVCSHDVGGEDCEQSGS